MTPEAKIVYDRLRFFHQGQRHAISAKALSAKCGIRERGIREAVHALRVQHIPICSDPAIGIWFPVSRRDAIPATANLRKLFTPVREALDGLEAGLEAEFGAAQLFEVA